MASLARRLIDRVTIEAEVDTPDGAGGFTSAWQPLAAGASVAAEVYGLSGGEAMRAGVERAVNQYRVTIRRRDDVTAQHRLIWVNGGGLVLAVKMSMRDPKAPREATLLMCESGAVD